MRTTTEDLAKLPQWARFRIEILERDVEFYQHQHQAHQVTGEEATDTIIPGYGIEADRWLPKGSCIRFYLDRGGITGWIDCQLRDGKVEVMGGTTLILTPQASNVVKIKLEE